MNKILFVDDEKSIRLLYDDEFTEEGYHVITSNGDENLLEIIGNKKPDVIVMDRKLGKIDGAAVLQKIRKYYHDIPVILCTAYANFKDDMKSIGTDFLVMKSSDLTELKNIIKLVIGSPNESQQKKIPEEKIILPHLFREQIEQGIKGLRHDMDSVKGGL
jgi:DNA-binding NtrC family response regulator